MPKGEYASSSQIECCLPGPRRPGDIRSGSEMDAGSLAALIGRDYTGHYINGQGSQDGLMFYDIPVCKTSPDGARSSSLSQLTNSLGEMAPSVEGSCPETDVTSLEHGPTGRCFKTNPQRTRPLSGANFLAASEVRFDGGPLTGRSSSLPPSQTGRIPKGVEERGRSSRSWHLCMCKTSPPRTRHRMWSRGRGVEVWRGHLAWSCRHG